MNGNGKGEKALFRCHGSGPYPVAGTGDVARAYLTQVKATPGCCLIR